MRVLDLGLIDYQYAYNLQKDIVEQVKENKTPDTLILCQHYPVITLGRLARKENILIDEKVIEQRGIKIYKVDRGGDVTLHNPGQLVVYPIFDLHRFKMDLKWFLDKLENLIIDSLNKFSIQAGRRRDLRGIWIGNNKLASIGIGVKNWITFHGVGINICNDLGQFSLIRPCGLDVNMTSVKENINLMPSIDEIKDVVLEKFQELFNLSV